MLNKNIKILFCFIILITISCLRFANSDETEYLRNTIILSENIRQGQLFGLYYTGLHGFLFNMPLSIIFLITGPSVFYATFYNLIITTITVILIYKIFNLITKNKNISQLVTLLIVTNYHFINQIPSYLKDIQSILSIIIFLYIFLFNKSKYKNILLGLSFILILDAKEYVFFIIAPSYFLFTIISAFLTKQKITIEKIKYIFKKNILIFIPSLIWILLMIFTPIIPSNPFLNAIIGTTKNKNYITNGIEIETAKQYVNNNKYINLSTFLKTKQDNTTKLFQKITNTTCVYFAKILSPRSFSFISIPKIIIIPAIFYSFIFFKKHKKNKKIILPIFFWAYLSTYILKPSHGRYLLPISPMIYYFYVLFLYNANKKPKRSQIILLCSILFFVLGLGFEEKFLTIKIIINSILIILTIISIKNIKIKKYDINKIIIIGICVFSTGTALMSSYSIGQIGQYLRWGYNGEIKKIISYFKPNETILMNNIENWNELPFFYRKDTNIHPEQYWELDDWVPKKYMLRKGEKNNTFNFTWTTKEELKEKIEENNIQKIVIIKSTLPDYSFPMQNKIEELKNMEGIKLETIKQLKNKYIYIFNINNKQ